MQLLLIKTSAIGDVIHALPLVDAIKESMPDCMIDWVVERAPSPLVQALTNVRRTIILDLKRWKKHLFQRGSLATLVDHTRRLRATKYDLAIDLQGNLKSGLLLHLARASRKAGFSLSQNSEWPNRLFVREPIALLQRGAIREDYFNLVQTALNRPLAMPSKSSFLPPLQRHPFFSEECAFLNERPILVAFGSHWENKKISFEQLVELLRRIEEVIPHPLLLLHHGSQEYLFAQRLQGGLKRSLIAPELPLDEIVHLLNAGLFLLSMDSALLHLAGYLGKPTFAIFGPSNGTIYNPPGDLHAFVQGACPFQEQFFSRCRHLRSCATGGCIKELAPVTLFSAILRLYQRLI